MSRQISLKTLFGLVTAVAVGFALYRYLQREPVVIRTVLHNLHGHHLFFDNVDMGRHPAKIRTSELVQLLGATGEERVELLHAVAKPACVQLAYRIDGAQANAYVYLRPWDYDTAVVHGPFGKAQFAKYVVSFDKASGTYSLLSHSGSTFEPLGGTLRLERHDSLPGGTVELSWPRDGIKRREAMVRLGRLDSAHVIEKVVPLESHDVEKKRLLIGSWELPADLAPGTWWVEAFLAGNRIDNSSETLTNLLQSRRYRWHSPLLPLHPEVIRRIPLPASSHM